MTHVFSLEKIKLSLDFPLECRLVMNTGGVCKGKNKHKNNVIGKGGG
jgi:hypothetical protein